MVGFVVFNMYGFVVFNIYGFIVFNMVGFEVFKIVSFIFLIARNDCICIFCKYFIDNFQRYSIIISSDIFDVYYRFLFNV